MKVEQKHLFGPVMFWTVLTSTFVWLPLIRIIGRPDGYQWGILGLSGKGTEGPYWVWILLTLYVLIMLYSAFRGPRALFYPMLILWHLAVTGVVVMATVFEGTEAAFQGQGLHFSIPMWLLIIPFTLFVVLAIAWIVRDYRAGGVPEKVAWTRANSRRLVTSALLLVVALALFRAGNNYNWVTATAIITAIVQWILLVQSFQPMRAGALRT